MAPLKQSMKMLNCALAKILLCRQQKGKSHWKLREVPTQFKIKRNKEVIAKIKQTAK